jgi:splicing factor 1
MARDCPDRQKGTDWRNNDGAAAAAARPAARVAGRIGDAVDREYESLMQELSGGGPGAGPQGRIEAGPGGGQDDSSLPPWQRGATGAAAPWSRPREDRNEDAGSARPWAAGGAQHNGGAQSYGYGNQASYAGAQGGSAPWAAQQAAAAVPAAGQAYDYAAYYAAAYAAAPGMQQYYGATGVAAPPPPPGEAPPPPVSIFLYYN